MQQEGPGMSFFTHYWSGETFKRLAQTPGGDLDHTAGNQFNGVMPGDTVYVISFFGGVLYVVGRMTVERVATREEAIAVLGTSDLWDAKQHVIAKQGTSSRERFDVPISQSDVWTIEFIDSNGAVVPPKRNRHGRVDPQTFRGVREITAPTASLLDSYLDS